MGLGVVNSSSIEAIGTCMDGYDDIMDVSDTPVSDARSIMGAAKSFYGMSTGSFRFSNIVFDECGERVFASSLHAGETLAMRYQRGRLAYKLNQHQSYSFVADQILCEKELRHTEKGKGKGKAKGKGPYGKGFDRPGRFGSESMSPCIWIFGELERYSDSGVSGTAKIVVRSRPPVDASVSTQEPVSVVLWRDRLFCDCTVECNGVRLRAHKAVLCACCPVFKAAFTGHMREAADDCFVIRQCKDPAAVEAMIEFLYTRRLSDVSVASLAELLRLSFMYELHDLSRATADRMIEKVHDDTRTIARALTEFRSNPIVSDYHEQLLELLKGDDDLLTQALC